MGVDHYTHIVYGFRTTREELIPLALELELTDSEELEVYGTDCIEEFFDGDDCHATELGEFYEKGEVIIFSDSVDLSLGQCVELPIIRRPAGHRKILGLAERLGKELNWHVYMTMSY